MLGMQQFRAGPTCATTARPEQTLLLSSCGLERSSPQNTAAVCSCTYGVDGPSSPVSVNALHIRFPCTWLRTKHPMLQLLQQHYSCSGSSKNPTATVSSFQASTASEGEVPPLQHSIFPHTATHSQTAQNKAFWRLCPTFRTGRMGYTEQKWQRSKKVRMGLVAIQACWQKGRRPKEQQL